MDESLIRRLKNQMNIRGHFDQSIPVQFVSSNEAYRSVICQVKVVDDDAIHTSWGPLATRELIVVQSWWMSALLVLRHA